MEGWRDEGQGGGLSTSCSYVSDDRSVLDLPSISLNTDLETLRLVSVVTHTRVFTSHARSLFSLVSPPCLTSLPV